MPVYAVTGASGHLGRFAIERLLARDVPPSEAVAVVRDRGKATVRDHASLSTIGRALAALLAAGMNCSQDASRRRP
jgi:uncharacterized protein YbjT (DUF2867 family)